MPLAFNDTPEQFRADLIAVCGGNVAEAREAYDIVAADGWAPAYLEAFSQKHLKLPTCSEQPVSALTSEGRSLAESIVERAVAQVK